MDRIAVGISSFEAILATMIACDVIAQDRRTPILMTGEKVTVVSVRKKPMMAIMMAIVTMLQTPWHIFRLNFSNL